MNFPWKEKRMGADDLRIMLAPAQPTAPTEMAEAAPTSVDKPAIANKVMLPSAVEHSEAAAVSIPPPISAPSQESVITTPKRPDVNLPIAPEAPRVRAAALPMARTTPAQVSEMPVPSDAVDAAQKQIDQDTQERALEQARINRETQNSERLRQAELMADAKREAIRQEQLRQIAARAEQTARNEAARIEAERQELVRQEGLRREARQKERAMQDEKAQQEAARQELERAEAARLEAGRREAARQEQARQAQLEATRLAQLEAARQARLDAERQEAAKQEATRQDALKQAAARQDAAKQEAARQEAANKDQAQRERAEQEAKREERLRAIGKQLAEEAAQRDAASNRPSRSLLPTVSSLRRGWLLGRADPNTELVLYAEAMSRKIEMNMTFDMVREAVKQPHAQPIVTVAVRADGSVEKVTFVVSSGVAAIDEAIRKVVASQAPYSAFPPALARQYDVIEIRRTWTFDVAIRLQ
jgi:chemotaxis protein histidine kinase CheA